MGFNVELDDLRNFAKLIERAVEDEEEGSRYLSSYDEEGASPGQFLMGARVIHMSITFQAATLQRGLIANLDLSAAGLDMAIEHYEDVEEQAARIDAGYAPAVRQPPQPPTGREIREVREPTAELTEPKIPDDLAWKDPAGELLNGAVEQMKAGGVVHKILTMYLNTDPAAQIYTWVVGNWQVYLRYAAALYQLAELQKAVAENIRAGLRELDSTWHGNAADAAHRYFSNLADALDDYAEELVELGFSSIALGRAVYLGMETIKGLTADLIDRAIIIALALSGDMPILMQIAELNRIWNAIVSEVERIFSVIERARIAVYAVIAGLKAFPFISPVSDDAYEHPSRHR